MKFKFMMVVFIVTMMFGVQSFAGDASIKGTIKFEGDAPNMKVLKMSADPKCVTNNQGKEVKSPSLVLGPEKTVANIFVKVKSGLPAGKKYPTATEVVTIDQLGCMYLPHVVGVMKDQTVQILNSDGTLHNVHGLPKVNPEFNVAMPAFKKKYDKTFEKVEDPFKVKCDVHPWMGGYIAVMDHPFFSVTKEDGKFEIKGLEPGTYEIEIWHEKLGTQTATVTVVAGESKVQDFTVKKPAKVGQLDTVMIVR